MIEELGVDGDDITERLKKRLKVREVLEVTLHNSIRVSPPKDICVHTHKYVYVLVSFVCTCACVCCVCICIEVD